jgi:S1-C subfamily serine protease
VVIGLDEYLLGGDIVSEVNGTPLTELDTVLQVVRGFRVGDRVNVKYWRDGMRGEVMVVLPERPVLAGDGFRFRERSNAGTSRSTR